MSNLEQKLNHGKEKGSCIVPPIEVFYQQNFSALDAAEEAEQLLDISVRLWQDFLRPCGLETENDAVYKATYYSGGLDELHKIFPGEELPDSIFVSDDIFQHYTHLLQTHEELYLSLPSTVDMLYDKDDKASLEYAHNTQIYPESGVAMEGDEAENIKESLCEFRNYTQEVFETLSGLQSLLSDKERLVKQHRAGVFEYGEQKYKEKVLDYLRDEYGYDDIADLLMEMTSFDDIHQRLMHPKAKDLPLANLYQTAKEDLKNNKNKNSNYLKKIKQETKEMKKELRHIAQYFKPDFRHLSKIESVSKKVLKGMSLNESNLSYQEKAILTDFSYDPQKDFSAGEVSQDCTRKAPLPFYHPAVHNVKLYDKNDGLKNIGNIYIVESENHRQQPILHIEAFQAPGFTSQAAKSFLDDFLPKLKNDYEQSTGKENVVITMNKLPDLRSNYFLIQQAMDDIAGELTNIRMCYPELVIPKGYSCFQGGQPGETCSKYIIHS